MTTRLEQYKALPDSLKQIYSSELTSMLYDQLEGKYGIKDKIAFIDTVSDVILGTYTTTQLPKLLEINLEIDEAKARAIVEDLRGLMGPVYDRENGTLQEVDVDETEDPETIDKPAPNLEKVTPNWSQYTTPTSKVEDRVAHVETPTIPQAQPPATTEPASGQQSEAEYVTPMHTMEGDMQKIHGYGAYRQQYPTSSDKLDPVVQSSQSEVLNRTAPRLADTPKVEDDQATQREGERASS